MSFRRWVLSLSLGVVSRTAAPAHTTLTVPTSAAILPEAPSHGLPPATVVAYEFLAPEHAGVRQVFDDAVSTL